LGGFPYVPIDIYSTNLTFTYPIYTGRKLEELKNQARKEVEYSLSEQEATKQELIFNVKKLYYELLKLKNIIILSEKAKILQEKQLDILNKKFKEGKATELEIIQKKIDLQEKEKNYVVSLNNREITKNIFLQTLGIKIKDDFDLQEDISLNIQEIDENVALNYALSNRPEIVQMKIHIDRTKSAISIAKSERKPNVGLYLNYYWVGDTFPPEAESWAIGIGARQALFSGIVKAKIIEAQKNLKLLENTKTQLQEKIILEVKQAISNLKNKEKEIAYLNLLLEGVKELERGKKVQRSLNLISEIDLEEVELQRLQAEINYKLAIYDYKILQAELEKVMGKN
jgi:outer membrane protein TolC